MMRGRALLLVVVLGAGLSGCGRDQAPVLDGSDRRPLNPDLWDWRADRNISEPPSATALRAAAAARPPARQ